MHSARSVQLSDSLVTPTEEFRDPLPPFPAPPQFASYKPAAHHSRYDLPQAPAAYHSRYDLPHAGKRRSSKKPSPQSEQPSPYEESFPKATSLGVSSSTVLYS